MKPIPLSAFIPPVTGFGHIPGSVVANSFDTSGVFRARSHSIKRRRDEFENSDFDRRFDLTKEFLPLFYPSRQGIDLEAASAALVGVMEKAPAIRALAEGGDDIDPDIKKVAEFGISVLT